MTDKNIEIITYIDRLGAEEIVRRFIDSRKETFKESAAGAEKTLAWFLMALVNEMKFGLAVDEGANIL